VKLEHEMRKVAVLERKIKEQDSDIGQQMQRVTKWSVRTTTPLLTRARFDTGRKRAAPRWWERHISP
jgi:hypothetical protein